MSSPKSGSTKALTPKGNYAPKTERSTMPKKAEQAIVEIEVSQIDEDDLFEKTTIPIKMHEDRALRSQRSFRRPALLARTTPASTNVSANTSPTSSYLKPHANTFNKTSTAPTK